MKNRLLIAFALLPLLTRAHAGHDHNATEIILNPSMWNDHLIIVMSIVLVVAIMAWRVLTKFYPNQYKLIKEKIFSDK